MKDANLHVRLPTEDMKKLELYCMTHGCNKSWLTRKAIKLYIALQEKKERRLK